MHAYCLFCETQKCDTVALMIERKHGVRCISPRIIQRKWVKGTYREVWHKWLPGYVFVYSEEPVEPGFEVDGVIRVLGRGSLQGEDRTFAQMVHDCDGVMGTIRLAEAGDRCVVSDPAWNGMEGTVLKVDRGRKRCCVAFVFDGQRRSVWLGYEMVRPVPEKQPDAPEPGRLPAESNP